MLFQGPALCHDPPYSEPYSGELGTPSLISRLPRRFSCGLLGSTLQSCAFIKRKLGRIETDIALPTVITTPQSHPKQKMNDYNDGCEDKIGALYPT